MEFPHLGQHCAVEFCKKLDFLPHKCNACTKTFCNEHWMFESHDCEAAIAIDNKVPVCPLCEKPVSRQPHESVDMAVSRHIDNGCEINETKTFTYQCALLKCRSKEVVPILCNDCSENFCIKHRNPLDHNCKRVGKAPPNKTMDDVRAKDKEMGYSKDYYENYDLQEAIKLSIEQACKDSNARKEQNVKMKANKNVNLTSKKLFVSDNSSSDKESKLNPEHSSVDEIDSIGNDSKKNTGNSETENKTDGDCVEVDTDNGKVQIQIKKVKFPAELNNSVVNDKGRFGKFMPNSCNLQ